MQEGDLVVEALSVELSVLELVKGGAKAARHDLAGKPVKRLVRVDVDRETVVLLDIVLIFKRRFEKATLCWTLKLEHDPLVLVSL